MQKTTQINIKMPEKLINDINFITKNLGINRAEWMKVKLAEMIAQEKVNSLNNIEKQYTNGFMVDKEFKEKTGFSPTKEMKEKKEKISKETKAAFQRVLKEQLETAIKMQKNIRINTSKNNLKI